MQDPNAPPHHLLRRIPPPTPLSRSFVEALMDRGGDDGRKRRLDEPGWRAAGVGYGRRAGGGRDGGSGGRQEGGGRGDGGWQDRDGGRRKDQGRFEAGYRYQDGDQGYRYQESGREDWDAPPPSQGDRGPRAQAKVKGKKNAGSITGAAAQKGKNKVGQAKARALAAGECFMCGREGHYQSECQFEPLCVICSCEGHSSASCPGRGRMLRLQSMGHVITDGGFFNIDVEPLRAGQGARESFTAVIKFKDEPLPEDKLSEELNLLVDDLWDWQETEIREAFLAPKPNLVLPSTWVRLTGVPEVLMTKERLMAAFVMVFVNGEGYTVMLQAEAEPCGGAGGSHGGPPPPPRSDSDDVDSDEISSDDEWNKHRKKSTGQDKEKGKEKELGAGKSMTKVVMDSALAHGRGSLDATEGSLVSTETDSQVTDPVSSWVAESPSMGGPPSKIASMDSPARESVVDKQDWVVTDSEEDGDSRGDTVVALATKKDLVFESMVDVPLVQGRRSMAIMYARKKKEVVAAVRKSGRHDGADAGTPALEKAHRLAAEKNLENGKDKAKFLKGWGANLGKEKRDFRAELLRRVGELDSIADSTGLDDEGWALRYHLEDQLVHMDEVEEEYWRQCSRLQWTLKGDACTAYFHAIANGRRRKCMIPCLRVDDIEICDQKGLIDHIYSLYSGLMGAEGEQRVLSLGPGLSDEAAKISQEENLALEITFTPEELDDVLHSIKQDSAPGLDGFPVLFFKKFCRTLKGPILQILNNFALGRVDIARLNFSIISLIPKVKEADDIKQFQPIALINVIFMFIAKAYAMKLGPLA
ncbi:hypothetical protein QYE76_048937 [Lolium multiflorum]|uniref:CCHC-type domain-containing protein n=1 Tax=Lolium multiflorum TaxID=4521 RepID=A0AAD8SM01_LOLMU|nr:hypothetical protein QYE76_048937 [Lolium multiflorum]